MIPRCRCKLRCEFKALFFSSSANTVLFSQYQNMNSLERELASVSTPGSPNYGHYYDLDQMNSQFGPMSSSVANVTQWLQAAGSDDIAVGNGIVTFKTTVGKANKMLDTQFKVYTNGAIQQLRTTSYSIPDDLVDDIDLVSPTVFFGGLRTRANRGILEEVDVLNDKIIKRQLQTSCEVNITYITRTNKSTPFTLLGPECFKELYNIGGYQADPASGSSVAFGSFLNQSASYSDLAQFEQLFNIPAQNFTVLALVNGGVDNQDPATEGDGEANLDVQNIIGLVDGLPVGEYITGGSPPFIPDLLSPTQADNQNEPYLEYYQYLLSQPNSNLPYVISNSYGDHENTVPERYATRVCNMIGMMGLRGRTILESSGDEGVGAVCRNNAAPYQPQFTPQFPGTCPYITAVGGTQFYNPEEAWNASSGGFSFYFKRPWYQQSAVTTYLNNYISPSTKSYYASNNYTDFSGRGFPDISAHSLWPWQVPPLRLARASNIPP